MSDAAKPSPLHGPAGLGHLVLRVGPNEALAIGPEIVVFARYDAIKGVSLIVQAPQRISVNRIPRPEDPARPSKRRRYA